MKAQPSRPKKVRPASPTPSTPSTLRRISGVRLAVQHNARSRRELSTARLRKVAGRALLLYAPPERYAVSLAFVSDGRMQRLNREYAGSDYTTDVLSFPAREDTGTFHAPHEAMIFLGDIAIAIPQAARQAREAGHSLQREVEHLLAHGMLHLLGYDHQTRKQSAGMDTLQQQILSSL